MTTSTGKTSSLSEVSLFHFNYLLGGTNLPNFTNYRGGGHFVQSEEIQNSFLPQSPRRGRL